MPPRRNPKRKPRIDDPAIQSLEESFGRGIEKAKGMPLEMRIELFREVSNKPGVVSPRGDINLARAEEELRNFFGAQRQQRTASTSPSARRGIDITEPFLISALETRHLPSVRARGFNFGPGFTLSRTLQAAQSAARGRTNIAFIRIPVEELRAKGAVFGRGPFPQTIDILEGGGTIPRNKLSVMRSGGPREFGPLATIGVGVGTLGLTMKLDQNEDRGTR